jgi:hypothetical protein
MPRLKPMKNGVLHWLPAVQMLDYDPLEQFRGHPTVPHAIGVNDNDRAFTANTQAWSFSAFHSMRTKEEAFSIQKIGEKRIELASARIRRAKAARTYKDMPGIGLHSGLRTTGHRCKISDTQIPLADTDSPADYP